MDRVAEINIVVHLDTCVASGRVVESLKPRKSIIFNGAVFNDIPFSVTPNSHRAQDVKINVTLFLDAVRGKRKRYAYSVFQ